MVNIFRSRLLASSLLVGAAFVAQAAQAQATTDAAAPATPQSAASASGGEIVVTGTLIRNPNLTSSAPIMVTDRKEIQLKQSNNAEELLRDIPGLVPAQGSAVNNGSFGFTTVNLRGLGDNRNVVLLDGTRIVPATLTGVVDLNDIPLALAEARRQGLSVVIVGACGTSVSTTLSRELFSSVAGSALRKPIVVVDPAATKAWLYCCQVSDVALTAEFLSVNATEPFTSTSTVPVVPNIPPPVVLPME